MRVAVRTQISEIPWAVVVAVSADVIEDGLELVAVPEHRFRVKPAFWVVAPGWKPVFRTPKGVVATDSGSVFVPVAVP